MALDDILIGGLRLTEPYEEVTKIVSNCVKDLRGLFWIEFVARAKCKLDILRMLRFILPERNWFAFIRTENACEEQYKR
jgi:hypothetical protein